MYEDVCRGITIVFYPAVLHFALSSMFLSLTWHIEWKLFVLELKYFLLEHFALNAHQACHDLGKANSENLKFRNLQDPVEPFPIILCSPGLNS